MLTMKMFGITVMFVLCVQVFGQHTVDDVTDSQRLLNKLDQLMDTIVDHGNKLEEQDSHLKTMEQRLDGHDERHDDHDDRLGGHDERLDDHDNITSTLQNCEINVLYKL